jgi:hypothetical protein
MADYVECPFCERIFEADAYPGLVHQHPLDAHIRTEHRMVKVRKGSNYRWVPEDEVKARLSAGGSPPPGRQK